MMLQLARRGRLLYTASKLQGFPTPAPAFTAAISSTAGSKSSSLLNSNSLHAQDIGLATNELKAQLAARNLRTKGKKLQLVERLASGDIFRARPFSTSARQKYAIDAARPSVGDVPAIPKPMEMTKEPETPIRVPLAPDNQFARYHRREVVPEVALPLKHEVSTVLSDAENIVNASADVLTNVLKNISVEAKAHKSEEKYAKEHEEVEKSVKGVFGSLSGGLREVLPDKNSSLYIAARFPVDLVRDMLEDALSAGHEPQAKQDNIGKHEEAKDEEQQELTDEQRTALYTIGGVSVVWYFLGW